MHYSPPTTADLRRLKDELGMTGVEMAQLFGLAGGQQWRKYTGGQAPRSMGLHMLFFAAARLELQPEELDRIVLRMNAAGASVALGDSSMPEAALAKTQDASGAESLVGSKDEASTPVQETLTGVETAVACDNG